MRTGIVAALGVALVVAPVGAAGAQPKGKPGVPPAPVEAPRKARGPLPPGILEGKVVDGMLDMGPMLDLGVMRMDLEPVLAGVGPMLADLGPMLHGLGPMLADLGPAIEPMMIEPMVMEPMMLDHVTIDGSMVEPILLGTKVELTRLDGAREAIEGARVMLEGTKLVAHGTFGGSGGGFADFPRAAWLATDQADSTYREARDALNREQYERASDLFRRIWSKMPRSGYAADALYWDAFALYRAGGDERLREALRLLDRQAKDYPKAGTRESAATLATRIRGQLAQNGDVVSGKTIRDQATRQATCENDDIRITAINALSQMDAERALPIVRRVLAKRDECSAPLREKAVVVVSQHHPADADQILLDVVKNDPSSRVRRQAVYYLGQTRSDRAIAALEQLVRTSDDREVQERALYSLAENSGARGGEILRAVAENESATESLRSKAIYYLRERRGGDNSAYLRQLYPKLNSTKLREQVMYSLGEIGGEENLRWLTNIAMDTTETVKVRSAALYRVSEARGSTAELISLYDRLRGREMRERALYYLGQRKEPAATAKLVDILRNDPERSVREKALYQLAQREDGTAIDRVIEVAKGDPDRELRRKAVYYLGQSKDPRAIKALEEIIGQ